MSQHWFMEWFVVKPLPRPMISHCRLGTNFKLNGKKNFIREKVFQHFVYKINAILSPYCCVYVKYWSQSDKHVEILHRKHCPLSWNTSSQRCSWKWRNMPLCSVAYRYSAFGIVSFDSIDKSMYFNSLAWEIWMKVLICNLQGILMIDGQGIFCEIALIWMSVDFTDDQSTLVQVMAWCRQWTIVDQDLQRHMASLDPNELTEGVRTMCF